MTEQPATEGCPQLIWRVTYDGSPWGIQSWDQKAPAQGQTDALNKVLPDTRHFISHEPCGRHPAFGELTCTPHGRA